jgi:hypothetical protein
VRHALHEALDLGPVHQLDDAVMAQLQPIGQLPYRRPSPFRKALDRQEKLVVLRGQPEGAHRLLAEAHVAADPEAEASQRLKVRLRQWFAGPSPLDCHDHITPLSGR